MIAYLKGTLAYKSPTYVVLETLGGIGYQVNISLHTFAQIEKREQTLLYIHTHTNTQDFAQTLYGFADMGERSIFAHLISVNGVGTNTARIVLSGLSPDEVRAAIIGESEAVFNRVKGIGPKTAKRIIVELKDKMMKDGGGAEALNAGGIGLSQKNNTLREEAIVALQTLGFIKINVQKAVNAILREQPEVANVETLIKLALKTLS